MGLRDRCILEMLYSCGLRASEICSLKINNIQFDLDLIRFFGKGNKERMIPLTYYARRWLERYLTQSRRILSERSTKGSNFVFLSNNGLPLTRVEINRAVKKYIDKNCTECTKTLKDFNRVLSISAKDTEALNNRGWTYQGMGKHDLACADWKKSKKYGNPEAKLILKNTNCK